MSLKQIGILTAAIILTAILVRELFPKERDRVVRLPTKPDTVEVTKTQLDTIWRERVRTREVVTTDTINLTDTVFQTRVETVAVLPGRWYLDSLVAGQEFGDTAHYALTFLAADSTGIFRQDAIERQIQTGPIRQVSLDSAGLHVDYKPTEQIPKPCGLFCKAKWVLFGAAGGFIGGAIN